MFVWYCTTCHWLPQVEFNNSSQHTDYARSILVCGIHSTVQHTRDASGASLFGDKSTVNSRSWEVSSVNLSRTLPTSCCLFTHKQRKESPLMPHLQPWTPEPLSTHAFQWIWGSSFPRPLNCSGQFPASQFDTVISNLQTYAQYSHFPWNV